MSVGGGSGSRAHNTRRSSLDSGDGGGGGSLWGRISNHRRIGGPNTGGCLASYKAVVAGNLEGPGGEGNHIDNGQVMDDKWNEWTQRTMQQVTTDG